MYVSALSLSHVLLFVTPWTAARLASLPITKSHSLLKLMSIESVMTSATRREQQGDNRIQQKREGREKRGRGERKEQRKVEIRMRTKKNVHCASPKLKFQ